MGVESKFSKMEIGTSETTSMEWQMAMVNTSGPMGVCTREILNTVSGMAMGYGLTKRKYKSSQAVIGWTKSKATESMSGWGNKFTKVNLRKTSEKVTGS